MDEKDRIDRVFKSRRHLAGRYSLDIAGNRYNFLNLLTEIETFLKSHFENLSDIRLLDVGCGDMFWLEEMINIGFNRSHCFGVDLLEWRLRQGLEQGRQVQTVISSGGQLPFGNGRFDVVSQFTMMTSVLDTLTREMIAAEMKRVLRPGGYILWYDFRYNNPANPHTRAIGRHELEDLFHGLRVARSPVTVIPQLARKVGPFFFPLLKFAAAFPILRTHYLALIGPKG